MNPAKMSDAIKISFGVMTAVGPGKEILDGPASPWKRSFWGIIYASPL